jgi:hypothetical protein
MAESLSRCKTAALRELFEGAPPTLLRLAAAAGRLPARLTSTAQRERWGERPAELGAGERAVRLAALGDWLISRLEWLRRRAERDGAALDRAEVEAIGALMRTVERLAVVADGFAEAGAAQIEHDRRKADVLARIDRRIAELAREFAARAGPAAAGRPAES